jgi:ribosomal protein S18 acetylase RimI-like enzyme
VAFLTRTLVASDLPRAVALLNAAYGPNPTFEPRLRSYVGLEPEGWIVIERGGALIGVGGLVRFGACGYVGLMGVAPEDQRRGVGAAIFEEVLRRGEGMGVSLFLLDASVSGAPLYAKYGFVDHGAAHAFVFDARPPGKEKERVKVTALGAADLDSVIALDAEGFGAERAALVRELVTGAPARAFVAKDSGGAVVGYAVGQPRSIGPCIALSAEVARALVRKVLALPFEGPVTWLVADQNPDAMDLARAEAGESIKSWRHMRRGKATALGADWSRVWAKGTLAVG